MTNKPSKFKNYTDFYEWTEQQVLVLKDRCLDDNMRGYVEALQVILQKWPEQNENQ